MRRLGIAQSLLNDPEILILDEPTSGLDPRERIRFRNMVGVLGRDRMVLLSSHIVAAKIREFTGSLKVSGREGMGVHGAAGASAEFETGLYC